MRGKMPLEVRQVKRKVFIALVGKRRRAAALQNADAPAKRLKMSKNRHSPPKPCLFGEKRVFFEKNRPYFSRKEASETVSDASEMKTEPSETGKNAWEMKKDGSYFRREP
jgi:hypothetical protein